MDTSERDTLIQAVKEGRLPSLGIHTSPNGLNDSQTNDGLNGLNIVTYGLKTMIAEKQRESTPEDSE